MVPVRIFELKSLENLLVKPSRRRKESELTDYYVRGRTTRLGEFLWFGSVLVIWLGQAIRLERPSKRAGISYNSVKDVNVAHSEGSSPANWLFPRSLKKSNRHEGSMKLGGSLANLHGSQISKRTPFSRQCPIQQIGWKVSVIILKWVLTWRYKKQNKKQKTNYMTDSTCKEDQYDGRVPVNWFRWSHLSSVAGNWALENQRKKKKKKKKNTIFAGFPLTTTPKAASQWKSCQSKI